MSDRSDPKKSDSIFNHLLELGIMMIDGGN